MIYFIIPAYNEAQNLPTLLDSLTDWARARHLHAHLVVVDDGSRDATAEIASCFRELPATVIRHSINLGVDQVFRTGFRAVSGFALCEEDIIVTLEADNTSSLGILDEMIHQAAAGFDVVLASCYAPGGTVVGVNAYRWFLSWCANLLLRSVPKMPRVHTFSSFYRSYRAPFFHRMLSAYGDRLIEETGFVCVVEILLKCSFLHARIFEVPMVLDGRRRQGPSTMKTLRTIRGYLRLALRGCTGRLARPLRVPEEQPLPKTVTPTGVAGD